MMLAAHSIGIGNCYVGMVNETFSSKKGKEIFQKWNINNNYKAFCHVLLGYPDGEIPIAKSRKEDRIIRI